MSLKNTVKVIKKGGEEGEEEREKMNKPYGCGHPHWSPSTAEAEEGSSRVQRPVRSTQQIPGQPGYILRPFLQKQNHKKKNHQNTQTSHFTE